ncbi:MAG: hypothetical protein V3T08_10265 [Gemmatimonadota bacterium]
MNAASSWRSWAAQASPALLDAFNGRTLEVMQCVRRRYPPMIRPDEAPYGEMKRECSSALLELAREVDPDFEDWDDAID